MSQNPPVPSTFEGVSPAVDLVQVQPGTVVSRTILKKSAGTITAFAFDAGEGLSEHTAPFDALILTLQGDAEITISGKPNRVSTGDLIKLPANESHAIRAISPFKMLLMMIRA